MRDNEYPNCACKRGKTRVRERQEKSLRQRIARGAAIGAIGGLILVLLIVASDPRTDFAEVLWLPLLLGVAGAATVLSREGARPYLIHEWAPIPAGVIRQHALRWYAANGWTLHANDARTLSFSRNSLNPQDLGCLALLSGLLAIVYLLGRKNLTTTVLLHPVPDGTEIEIIVNARGGGGQAAAVGFFNSLHELM